MVDKHFWTSFSSCKHILLKVMDMPVLEIIPYWKCLSPISLGATLNERSYPSGLSFKSCTHTIPPPHHLPPHISEEIYILLKSLSIANSYLPLKITSWNSLIVFICINTCYFYVVDVLKNTCNLIWKGFEKIAINEFHWMSFQNMSTSVAVSVVSETIHAKISQLR